MRSAKLAKNIKIINTLADLADLYIVKVKHATINDLKNNEKYIFIFWKIYSFVN